MVCLCFDVTGICVAVRHAPHRHLRPLLNEDQKALLAAHAERHRRHRIPLRRHTRHIFLRAMGGDTAVL